MVLFQAQHRQRGINVLSGMATVCKDKGEGIRLTRRCSTRKVMANPDPESVVSFCVRISWLREKQLEEIRDVWREGWGKMSL